jgi:hypothetical protein
MKGVEMSVASSLARHPLPENPSSATTAAVTALRHTMGRDAQIGGMQSCSASCVAGMLHARNERRITVTIHISSSESEYFYSLTANSSSSHWKSRRGHGTTEDLIEMIHDALSWANVKRIMDDKSV